MSQNLSATKREIRLKQWRDCILREMELDTPVQHRRRLIAALRELRYPGSNAASCWKTETLRKKLFGSANIVL